MYKKFNKVMCKDCVYCDACVYCDGGICRKNPPTVRQGGTAWPIVDTENDWCGDGVSDEPVYSGTCQIKENQEA